MKKILCFALILVLTLSFTAFASDSTVVISDPVAITGIGSDTITTVENPENLTANNTLQGLQFDVENNSDGNIQVTGILALYDANGLLKKMVSTYRTVVAGNTDTIGIGTIIPSTAGTVSYVEGKAKLYVWDTYANKLPYIGAFEYDLIAPTID